MPRNKIQFQKGLSEPEFERLYGREEACFRALHELRWPDGFVCPSCGHKKGHQLEHRQLVQCACCRTQTSITAGTIFHSTKLPLTTWFRAMYHLTQSKNGVSAMELMRRLGVSYNTAWLVKQKLMQTMKEREASRKLTDRIEIDDAYLGGERARKPGKAGRGAEGKTPFIAAVQTDRDGRPQRMALQVVDGFSNDEVSAFAKAKLVPGADVYSDGLACFGAVIDHGCSHTVVVSGGGRRAAQKPTFKWVNTALGNIKSALTGTYRQVSPGHRPRYLAEFQYRFNRRHDLAGILKRLAHSTVRTPPFPYRFVKLAESHA
ncbi:IS1595 family transposase [Granulosicoccus sp. 3-233]|uniref:IS1595 family transposase n=1 Tax=Granulosicoccus sp. 3-233 TaxID=3417969 RepID=UPI003D34FE52